MITYAMPRTSNPKPHFYVDGPNCDGVLGQILRHKPRQGQRPDWKLVRQTIEERCGEVTAEFVVNGNSERSKGFPFFRYLHAAAYRVRTPREADHNMDPDGDPVDDYILSQIHDLRKGGPTSCPAIIVATHDGDYYDPLCECLRAGFRIVIVGFKEWLARELLKLLSERVEFLDLEYDLRAFRWPLHRPWESEWGTCA